MKKLLLSMALFSVSAIGYAQSAKFSIIGGLNLANVSASNQGFSADLGTLTTFNAGVIADLKLGAVSIQPGVFYSGKGFDATTSSTDQVKMNINYLEIPVNIVYHVPVTSGSIFFGAGPYWALGVSGKTKLRSGGASSDQDITFGNGVNDIKRNDVGLQGIAGYQFSKGLLFRVSYDLGFSDISNDGSGSSIKNRVFGISVGYTF